MLADTATTVACTNNSVETNPLLPPRQRPIEAVTVCRLEGGNYSMKFYLAAKWVGTRWAGLLDLPKLPKMSCSAQES